MYFISDMYPSSLSIKRLQAAIAKMVCVISGGPRKNIDRPVATSVFKRASS